MSSLTMAAAIRGTLFAAMQDDARVLLLGENVGRAGGIAGTSEGFLAAFGEDRVLDLPIAERGTLGVAVGLALAGKRPVVELSSSSRLLAVLEVLAEAAALHGEFSAPVVVRVPTGEEAGDRVDRPLADLALPGLTVVCASGPSSAATLLGDALDRQGPTLLLEPRALYGSRRDLLAPTGGRAAVLREGDHVTLAAFGASVATAVDAADALAAEGISAAVLDLGTLSPLDAETLGTWTRHTGRLVAIHAGEPELAAKIERTATQTAFLFLESPPASAVATLDAAVHAARTSISY
jgi:2-oxoisovalerate dehydrogenase E1 component beta subunit